MHRKYIMEKNSLHMRKTLKISLQCTIEDLKNNKKYVNICIKFKNLEL